MPLYEYKCDACGQRFELIRRFSDPPVDVCTLCGKGPVIRLFSSPAIQFKGSGFYITDYARAGKADSASGSNEKGDKPQKAEGGASTDSKTESKTETKTEAKSESKPAPPSSS